MAKKRIVAYFMHETEREAARPSFASPEVTDSFIEGEVDETAIPQLRAAGLIIQEETPPDAPAPFAKATAPTPKSGMVGIAPTKAFDSDVPGPEDYYAVRLKGPLTEGRRVALDAAGAALIETHGRSTYKARITAAQVGAINALSFVDQVKWISPAESAAELPGTAAAASPAAGVAMLTFDVRLRRPEDKPAVEGWLRDRHMAVAGSSARKIRIYALENAPELGDLARLPEVDFVAPYVTPKLFNDAARRLLGVDALPGHNPATNLTQDGSGQIVAVADTGIDDQHPDFGGRIVGRIGRGRPGVTDDPHGHGTHVAGSVLGDGTASGGTVRGVAPGAQLFFQSLLDATGGLGGLPVDLNALFDEAYVAGARIHNNSWGAATISAYTVSSEEVDEFVRAHPDMLIVIAAGNEGVSANPRNATKGFVDWLSIGSPASCKNALTVGASRSDRADGATKGRTWGAAWPANFPDPPIAGEAITGDPNCLAAFSSRGPCDDRRIKPDVVAPGTDIASAKSSLAPIGRFWGAYPATPGVAPNPRYAFDGGTSMATPLVSGCAALVRQYYVNDRGHQPSAALLKATLINSTTWLIGADSAAPVVGVPNFHQGHGRVNMQQAIPNPSNPNLRLEFADDWNNAGGALTVTGDRRRWQFTLPAGVPELRLCLAYTDAPARGLQNNVNLFLQHLEGNTKWVGNQQLPAGLTALDVDNNVESIRVAHPGPGTYFIQVSAANLLKPPQDFALAVTAEHLSPITPI